MIAYVCSVCKKVYDIKEPEKPELLPSHGYCHKCLIEEMKKLEIIKEQKY